MLCVFGERRHREEHSVRATTLLNRLLNLQGLSVQGSEFLGGALYVPIRRRFRLLRCSVCGTRVRGRFVEKPLRTWRHLALGGIRVYLRGSIRRLRCPKCRKDRTEEVPLGQTRQRLHEIPGRCRGLGRPEDGPDGRLRALRHRLADRRQDRPADRPGKARLRPPPGTAASASTRSATGDTTNTSPSWSITTPGRSSGSARAKAPRSSRASSLSSIGKPSSRSTSSASTCPRPTSRPSQTTYLGPSSSSIASTSPNSPTKPSTNSAEPKYEGFGSTIPNTPATSRTSVGPSSSAPAISRRKRRGTRRCAAIQQSALPGLPPQGNAP